MQGAAPPHATQPLLTPVVLGGLELPNRMLMAPMTERVPQTR